jgi:alkylation response protein AidB-like acyl-CoA dehydrogenase
MPIGAFVDAQVLPIWEGTTNVLALDTLRASQGLKRFQDVVLGCVENVSDARLAAPVRVVRSAVDHAETWAAEAKDEAREAGARRFALTLGRTIELALLIKQAQWSLDPETLDSANRFANVGVDVIF